MSASPALGEIQIGFTGFPERLTDDHADYRLQALICVYSKSVYLKL